MPAWRWGAHRAAGRRSASSCTLMPSGACGRVICAFAMNPHDKSFSRYDSVRDDTEISCRVRADSATRVCIYHPMVLIPNPVPAAAVCTCSHAAHHPTGAKYDEMSEHSRPRYERRTTSIDSVSPGVRDS
jgi:hypothetical protein